MFCSVVAEFLLIPAVAGPHVKHFHIVKRLQNSVQYVRRYSTTYAEPRRENNAIWIRIYSSETTGPIFTKIFQDVAALVALFNLAHTRRYPITFLNDRAISAGGGNFAPFLPLNWLPWQRPLRNRKKWTWSRKLTQIPSIWWKDRENWSSRYWDSFALSKKKKKLRKVKYIALSASLPSGVNKFLIAAPRLCVVGFQNRSNHWHKQ